MFARAKAQTVIDGGHDQFASAAGEKQPVVGARDRLGEAFGQFFELVAGLVVQGIARFELGMDFFDRVQLPQPCLDLVGEMAVVSRQDQEIVPLLLEHEEIADGLRWGTPIRLHQQEDAGTGQPHIVQTRHDLDVLIRRPGFALDLEQPGQTVDQGLLQLGRGDLSGIMLDAPPQVLGFLEVEGIPFMMQIPGFVGALAQLFQGDQKFVGLAIGGGEVFDEFGLGQTGVGAHCAGQRPTDWR